MAAKKLKMLNSQKLLLKILVAFLETRTSKNLNIQNSNI